MRDTIYREDAIEAVKSTKPIVRSTERNWGKMIAEQHSKELVKAIKALPSAEAEPTVIRSRTFMPTKDFKEWAKRIRETNPNAVVIPCDAEVVSAEAVQGWIPCSERLPKSGRYLASCLLPVFSPQVLNYDEDDGEWFYDGCKSIDFELLTVIAWMPLPKPYKGGDDTTGKSL